MKFKQQESNRRSCCCCCYCQRMLKQSLRIATYRTYDDVGFFHHLRLSDSVLFPIWKLCPYHRNIAVAASILQSQRRGNAVLFLFMAKSWGPMETRRHTQRPKSCCWRAFLRKTWTEKQQQQRKITTIPSRSLPSNITRKSMHLEWITKHARNSFRIQKDCEQFHLMDCEMNDADFDAKFLDSTQAYIGIRCGGGCRKFINIRCKELHNRHILSMSTINALMTWSL